MSDNKKLKDYKDKSRINPNEDYELDYWSKKLNITKEELKTALKSQNTTSAKKIEEFFNKKS
jgi:hypothetical protein